MASSSEEQQQWVSKLRKKIEKCGYAANQDTKSSPRLVICVEFSKLINPFYFRSSSTQNLVKSASLKSSNLSSVSVSSNNKK